MVLRMGYGMIEQDQRFEMNHYVSNHPQPPREKAWLFALKITDIPLLIYIYITPYLGFKHVRASKALPTQILQQFIHLLVPLRLLFGGLCLKAQLFVVCLIC